MEETQLKTLKHEILERGVKSLLDEAQVPMREHFKVLRALKSAMDAHGASNKAHEGVMEEHKKFSKDVEENITRHEGHMQKHERQISEWDKVSQQLQTLAKGDIGEKGDQGEPGVDGESPDMDSIVDSVLQKIPVPQDGKDGKDAELDQDALVKSVVAELQKSKALDLTHIKGAQKFIKDGVAYKVEELMHGGGGSKGGTFSIQVPTGTVNGVNKTFVFTTAPSVIVLDNGNFMNKVSSDGTVNWTGTTTVVLNQSPLFNVYGF